MVRKKKNRSRWGLLLFVAAFLLALYFVYFYYQKIYNSSAQIPKGEAYFYLHSEWDFQDLYQNLYQKGILKDTASFIWVAEQKSFQTPKAGRYLLQDGMSNNELVNLFRSGKQVPVKLTFNSLRTKEQLAGRVGAQLELDSLDLLKALNSSELARKYGFDRQTFITLFLPNTYEFYWNTTTKEFIRRMAKEYKRFWNAERKAKANALNLSQSDVSILASIVQAEQMAHPDERPKVAGLYINRLRRGMRLQSDPTLIYALGDFSIKRVLNQHKKVDSRYNTYLYAGLPPGPIYLPDRSSIDAVLNYEKHNYLYMCAKPDFSSYHNFSRTLSQHNVYARQYQRELNRRKIMR
ncbi:MAG: endolytic transglycosylase MltG [Vicingaceae bacterium]